MEALSVGPGVGGTVGGVEEGSGFAPSPRLTEERVSEADSPALPTEAATALLTEAFAGGDEPDEDPFEYPDAPLVPSAMAVE